MARGFSFEIMVCGQSAKLAAYETSGYLYSLLSERAEYKTRTPVRQNLKALALLLLPAAPWVGPPICHVFGITWITVKKLLLGVTGIACIKVKGG